MWVPGILSGAFQIPDQESHDSWGVHEIGTGEDVLDVLFAVESLCRCLVEGALQRELPIVLQRIV